LRLRKSAASYFLNQRMRLNKVDPPSSSAERLTGFMAQAIKSSLSAPPKAHHGA
jgi:hypothetical protein